MDEVMIIFEAKLSDNLRLFFPGGASFGFKMCKIRFQKGGVAPFQPPPGPCPWTPTISAEMVLDHSHPWI